MSEERRVNPNPFDIAGLLAILYTIGYIGMVAMLFFIVVPEANKDPLLQLFGLMSAIQMALIGFYFGGSKQVEATQRATEQRQGRAAAVVEEIAKAAAPVTAAAVAAARTEPAPPVILPPVAPAAAQAENVKPTEELKS